MALGYYMALMPVNIEKKVMIWSDVTIAGQTDERTNEQKRKDIASHYSGWVTQPMDHGWLRWAINWLSMVCFKITWYKIFQNTIRQFSPSRESRESRILGILATSQKEIAYHILHEKNGEKTFLGQVFNFPEAILVSKSSSLTGQWYFAKRLFQNEYS